MLTTTLLIDKLRANFPNITLTATDQLRWHPPSRTIFYDQSSQDIPGLLHELGHALLDHKNYTRDIELIKMESDAWQKAEQVGRQYDYEISPIAIEDALDTYRDWLHSRSVCPLCTATGLQIRRSRYQCLACTTIWRVNDARTCSLRRYPTKNSP